MMMTIPHIRKDTWDFDIFRDIAGLNEYKLPKSLKNFKVIDIGAHIGSFSWLCASLGCKEVFYCEASKDNFNVGMKWIEENYQSKKIKTPVFVSFNMAIWKNDGITHLNFDKCLNESNTGGGSVMTTNTDGEVIPTFPFDSIIQLRLNKDIDKKEKVLLKLDCEGSEFPILFDSKELNKVDYICGEYHEIFENIPEFAKVEGYDSYDAYTLQRFLKTNGFLYTFFTRDKDEKNNPLPLGHFWASRTKAPFFTGIVLSEKLQEVI